jgi:lipoate-protein ligase A
LPVNLLMTSRSLDVYHHLALESLILESMAADELLIYCWNSSPSLVLGKNQNVWKECNVRLARESGVAIARRISGGGTVYHGPGNYNISIFSGSQRSDLEWNYHVLIDMLKRCGIQAQKGPYHELVTDGMKISGSAFCVKKNATLHHATLLLNADLGSLHNLLVPSFQTIHDRSVASRPHPVVNCSAISREINEEMVVSNLVKSIEETSGIQLDNHDSCLPVNQDLLNSRRAEMAMDEWTLFYRSDFSVTLDFEMEQGTLSIEIDVVQGVIKEFVMLLCPVPENTVVCIMKRLIGVAFNRADIVTALNTEKRPDENRLVLEWLQNLSW